MKKIFYLFALMTSFAWSNNPIIDTEISLTDHSMIDLMDFDFNSITQQTTDTTSTGDVSNTTSTSTTTSDGGGNNTSSSSSSSSSSSGTSSNTCPEPYSDQPELSFSANTESFTFPLTELYNDPDINNSDLQFSIGQLNPSSAGQASLNNNVITVNFNNSDIAAGDQIRLGTSAFDGECSGSAELVINITAASGTESDTTSGGGNGNNSETSSNTSDGGGNNSETSSGTSCPDFVGQNIGNPAAYYLANEVNNLRVTLDLQSIWKSTNNDGLLYQVIELINTDEILSEFDGVDGDKLYYTLSGTSGFADILLRATSSDGCESDVFMYVIEVGDDSNNDGGPDNGGESDCTEIQLAPGDGVIRFDSGISPITVDFSSALSELGINSSDSSITSELHNEGTYGEIGSYDLTISSFSLEVPLSGDYAAAYDIDYFKDGECLGRILFIVANTGFDLEEVPEDEDEVDDGGGPDDGGPDDGDPDCIGFELGVEQNALVYPLGEISASISLVSALNSLGINPLETETSLEVTDEYGGASVDYSIDSDNNFNIILPQNDYILVIDVFYNDPSTGECLGHISFDITNNLDFFASLGPDGGGNQDNKCPELVSENGLPTYEGSNDVESLTIDLDEFFTDPDGDDLIYNVQFFGYPEGLVSPSINDNILTLSFSGGIGDGFVEIQVSDGECENGNGFEVRITQEVSEGCPPLIQNMIGIPIAPAEIQLWFPIEFLFDSNQTGPLNFDSISISDSSFAQLSLGEEEGYKVIYFDLPKDGPEGSTSFEVTVTTSDGGCGEVYTIGLESFMDQEFYDQVLQNSNEGGPDGGGSDGGGPNGDYDDDCYGNAPYPGDEGWCGAETPITFLDNVDGYFEGILAGDTKFIEVSDPIFDDPDVYIANIYSDNTCVASVSSYNGGPDNVRIFGVDLTFTGEPGSTAIVYELRKEGFTGSDDCIAIMVFFVDVNLNQGGGGGPGAPSDPSTGEGENLGEPGPIDCEFGPSIQELFITDTSVTSISRDLSAEIAALGLPAEGSGTVISLFHGSDTSFPDGGTIDENGIYTLTGLPGTEFYGFVEIIFTESSGSSGCYGAITFEIIISSGEFGEDPNAGPHDAGGPGPNTGPIDVPETTAGLGEAPYPGDPGFCSSDTQIIELPEVLTTTIENTVTTQISHPLLDEPGISIANVYTNDSNIATVKDFFPQNNSLILELTGQPGGVAIVLEVRKAQDLAPEDCAAVMFFILGVIDPGEIDCQVTQSFEPIFVEPGTQNALVDLTPFFDAFGGFETYSQSFKLDIVDPFLTVGQVFLDGTELSFEFNGIEGFDMLVFQNSDLNGNCINLLEVPVIVDPNAASLNPDSGGIGSQGPDEGLNLDCPGSLDIGTGEDAFYFELGNTSVNVDLNDAFQVIDILPSEVQIEAFISSEVGGNSGPWEIDATNTFTMQVPSGEYYILVDLYIKDPSTGQCLGVIIFDVAAFDTSENCIATTLGPDAANEVVWFSPGESFEQDFSDLFISTQGNALEIEITFSNDLVTVSDLGQGNFGFTAGDQSGDGEISIIVIDPSADCIFEILSIPFLVDPTPPEGQGPPPDFNCPQYIEDIMPIYASNADPREFTIDLNNFFFIPSSGIKYTLILPEEWGIDINGDGNFIENFVDITLDESFLRINTDNRFGEIMFQVKYESLNSSADSTCENGLIDLMINVDDELAFIEEQLQENCGDNLDYFTLGGDFAAVTLELGVQDDIKIELRDYLINPNADVDFYVRYDLMFPEPPVSSGGGLNSEPNMNIPLVDGFVSGKSELIVFAPRFEAGLGDIPIEVYDLETGCNYNALIFVEVVDNLGIADIDCPQPIMDFAEFTISQDEPLELNLADFFAISGDVSSTGSFFYEFGTDRPEKVQLELNEADNKIVITPTIGQESLGDVFIFIKAGDAQEYCEVFADIMVRILPSGQSESVCPTISEAFTSQIEWPDPAAPVTSDVSGTIDTSAPTGPNSLQDVLEINLNEFFTASQTLNFEAHADNNPQFDWSINGGILTLYLKEYIPGDVDLMIDAFDPFGCVVHEMISIRFGESSAEFLFNRCPEIDQQAETAMYASLASQGIIDGVMPSDVSFLNIPLTGLFTDPDGDTITYDAFSHDPSIASVDVVSNTLTIFFLPQQYGNVQFEFFARDGDPFCDPGLTLNISKAPPANIAPVVVCPEIISQIPPIEVVQGSALDVIPLNQLFADVSASSFDFYAVSANSGIVEAKIDGDKLILEYSSDTDGNSNVTVVSSNVSGTCDAELGFSVTVVPPAVNLAPVFEPGNTTVLENDAEETNTAIAKFASHILVSDPEGAAITLSISAGNNDNLFELRNGFDLFVIGKLDYEDKIFHELELTASDGEKTSTYLYRVNVGDIQNASINADFNLTVYDQANESDTSSGTTGRIPKNQAYKRFTNPRFKSQMEVGKWKVRKKITGGADAALFEINQEEEAGGPEARGSVNMIDVLDFKNPPDFENPQDHNKDNVYEVIVELINEDDGESEIPVVVNQREITVPENDSKTVEIQSIGASPAQDTDGDGVADVIDNSPLFANANQADADGDGVGDVTDDDDQDGVWNPGDGCANTTLGDRVDIYGCAIFYLPTNNFSITKSERCVGTNSISIASARADLDYTVTVSGAISQTTSFSGSSYNIENLSSGTYSVCLTVDGVSSSVYQRCYSMTITEPQPLSVYSITDPGNNSVTFNLDGGMIYNITHNGITTQTKESTYTVSLKAGMNSIDINTGIGCQGEFGTTYFNSSPVDLAPNPFKSSVKLYVGGDDEAVSVSVFNMTGNQVLRVDKVLEFGSRTLEINTTSLMAGSYLIKINGATTQQTFVAIKQ